MKLHSATWFDAGGKKPESEDALFFNLDEAAAVMVAVDGVTRDVGPDGKYPNPSPARIVAQAVARVIGRQLVEGQAKREQDLLAAFQHGNNAARIINDELGLWEDHDYLGRDLAGAVASCAVIRDGLVLWAYIGDCGVALLGDHGCILWRTADDVETVRPLFPKLADDASVHDRQARCVVVRRDFRNKPDAPHRTYGVLTGEPAAMQHVRVGCWKLQEHACAAVYTDGMAPLLLNREHLNLRMAILHGRADAIQRELPQMSAIINNADEKTIVFASPS